MFEAITSILRRLKALSGYVMLNGGYKYLQWNRKTVEGTFVGLRI